MKNEKYLNYYVEILTNTMTDAVVRNISLQANSKVTEEVIEQQSQQIEQKLQQIQQLTSQVDNLNKQVGELNAMRNEYENVKHQVQHINTFREQLIEERDNHKKTRDEFEKEIKLLNEKIEYLQLTPAKRKKIETPKLVEETQGVFQEKIEINNIIEDGGSF